MVGFSKFACTTILFFKSEKIHTNTMSEKERERDRERVKERKTKILTKKSRFQSTTKTNHELRCEFKNVLKAKSMLLFSV